MATSSTERGKDLWCPLEELGIRLNLPERQVPMVLERLVAEGKLTLGEDPRFISSRQLDDLVRELGERKSNTVPENDERYGRENPLFIGS